MRNVSLYINPDSVAALKEMGDRFIAAWKTGQSEADVWSFESVSALRRALESGSGFRETGPCRGCRGGPQENG